MLRLTAAAAFDAYLVSGGLPLVLDEWPAGVGALNPAEKRTFTLAVEVFTPGAAKLPGPSGAGR